MKVYSLFGFVDYESTNLVAVFGSLEDLLKFVGSMEQQQDDRYEFFDHFGYVECELGQPVDSMEGVTYL